ncbi:MBL fold metallo-hydrolase [Saccharopolyspora sp. HNM0983]|uniref:Linear primary-alkylsulfatase n=1 Tax=Saccharopolyspora montiporae TaxID=2781240 RepID=A0A929FXX1_9PSEU|nr:alkyl sulfatase dimerization domain-containing protein [Saccharopolyspora sp. HNM0983]MBE9372875.1 MBL fold metallo-hydrolase [Saccharopolyspora sp. HNM0983]
MTGAPREASEHIRRQNRNLTTALPFDDSIDESERGLIAEWDGRIIRTEDGRAVWDVAADDFLKEEAPDTVNPSLWRHSLQVSRHGLYKVTEHIYQVRGLDISNITFLEGNAGVVVVDPLLSVETASAALQLYREHRGNRAVTAVIYTHSHIDHFGGVKGVTSQEDVDAGRVPVIAPSGFLEHAVGENVLAGTAMARRAAYMFGSALERGPRGHVGAGIGQTTSSGTVSLIKPTVEIVKTGQERIVDGIRIIFQMTPDSEAPSEFHFYLPNSKALCVAENSSHTMHNVLTLRGALVRDPHAWADYLTETLDMWGDETEVIFGGHHWPTFGNDAVVAHLSLQRDMYAYIHDQTLRLLNQGHTGPEIAEILPLPPVLEQTWHTRGYYGTVNHNVKAVYQRYLGWYDGNPAHLWPHPPVARGIRYVRDMGGADNVLAKARTAYEVGDFRWAAEILNHVVFAEPSCHEAKTLLADTYEQLGYGAESGPWRSAYLSGAHELRHGIFGTPVRSTSADVVRELTPEQIFVAIAIRVDGPNCWDEVLTVDVVFEDPACVHRLRLANGVLTRSNPHPRMAAEATVTVPSPSVLAQVVFSGPPTEQSLTESGVRVDGDVSVLLRLLSVLDTTDPDFAIVTSE